MQGDSERTESQNPGQIRPALQALLCSFRVLFCNEHRLEFNALSGACEAALSRRLLGSLSLERAMILAPESLGAIVQVTLCDSRDFAGYSMRLRFLITSKLLGDHSVAADH